MKIKDIVVDLWCAFLFVNLSLNLLHPGVAAGSLEVFSFLAQNITNYLVPNFFWFFFVMALSFGFLAKVHPFFGWSWLGNNMGLMPLQKRYISFLFIFLLILNLPSITCFEEQFFRVGTASWQDGLVRSVPFGLAHIVMGIPICVGIAQIVLGLWLTWCYLMVDSTFLAVGLPTVNNQGLLYATMNHTMFNLIGCFAMLLCLIKIHIQAEKEDYAKSHAEKKPS